MTNEKISLRELLVREGYVVQPTVGNSMEPLLFNRQSLVKIEKTDGELPNYSVALYQRPSGQYVLHRIVKVRKDDYLIIGDNRDNIEKVPKSWVIGVLTEYASDGENWHSVRDPEYLEYVESHMEHFWSRYYAKKTYNLPGRAVRKAKRMLRKEA